MKLASNSNVKISLIVSNYNGKKFLSPCLRSILGEKTNNYEIVFVDDCSTDGSFELMTKIYSSKKNISLLQLDKHRGTGAAINAAVKISRGKYLFFLNNDTLLETGWSLKIINLFQKYKKLGVAQAKILRMGADTYDYAGDYIGPFGFLIERAQGAVDRGQFDKVVNVFSVKGTAMILRKDIFQKVGMFDEDYIFALEETDLTWRMWLSGYRMIFYPFITVWHAYGTKAKSKEYYVANKINYLGCRNTITTLIKNLETKNLFTILPINIGLWSLLSLLFLIQLKFDRAFYIWKGIIWNIVFLSLTVRKRRLIQKDRKITDDELFRMVGARRNLTYYLRKGLTYLTGIAFDLAKK